MRNAITGAERTELESAIARLAIHKVLPLLAYQLAEFGLDKQIPTPVYEGLRAARIAVGRKNLLLFLAAERILRVTRAQDEPQLALKGLVLADRYYPDISTRPMGDIDLVPVPERYEPLFRILEGLGFRPSETHHIQEDGVTYVNQQGLICDAHRRLSIFAAHPWETIVREAQLTRLNGAPILTLEPNAMVAHLVVHMGGHLPEIGAVLMWLLDVAFVLRRHGAELDPARIRVLCGSDADWSLFLRVLGFLQREGEEIPAALRPYLRFIPPLSLGFILRQRRLRPWGLPGAKGWLRVVAQRLALRTNEKRPRLESDDLWLWPADTALNVLAPQLVRWT